MKQLSVSVLLVVLGLYTTACSSERGTNATKRVFSPGNFASRGMRPLPVGHYIRGDYDDDDNGGIDTDDRQTRMYGRRADPPDTRAAELLIEHYYAAVAARDGAAACSLMDSRLAQSTDYARVVPTEYRPTPGSSVFKGKTCAMVATLVFEPTHQQLAADAATVKLVELRVDKNRALAILNYTTAPESQIPLMRERGVLKVDAFLAAPIV